MPEIKPAIPLPAPEPKPKPEPGKQAYPQYQQHIPSCFTQCIVNKSSKSVHASNDF